MDELTPTQLQTLQRLLVDRQKELGGLLHRSEDGAKPVDLDEPIGRLSRMEAIQQQHMAQATRHAQESELSAIRDALEEVEAGDYGTCQRCEEPIGFPRLKARPHAKICVRCQSRLEST